MEIFPAVDLQNGRCVRLEKGDFNAATLYDVEPLRSAGNFGRAGARWIHVVDLDGAKAGKMQQFEIIKEIVGKTGLKVQAGGGVRDAETVERLLECGVRRVVIGSLAVKSPELVKEWLRKFGSENILLAMDVRMNADNVPEVATHGWQSGSNKSLWEILSLYEDSGLKAVMCTDVGRDGMLVGANQSLYGELCKRYPELEVLASGGLRNQTELQELAALGVSGAIIGKAIYEGMIDLRAAIRLIKSIGGKE